MRNVFVEIIDRAFDNRGWQGPNLMSAMKGVSYKAAAKHFGNRKCIWQQLLHAAYWKRQVLHRINPEAKLPKKPLSNWTKEPKSPTDEAWQADLEYLRIVHRLFRKAVMSIPESRLKKDGDIRFRIEGVAAHDIYHAGQIKLLRRLVK